MANHSTIELDQEQLPEALSRAIRAKKVAFVRGSPGIGKSDIINQVAGRYNLEVVDMRLAQCDPTDLQGFPVPTGDKMDYVPPTQIPLEGDELPQGKDGWLLFLDEYTSAPLSVQAASYKIILDRKIGRHNIHPNVAMVAAGNKESDRAVTFKMSTAAQSRFVHYEMSCSHVAWLNWAAGENIDHRVTAYIKWKPESLHNFKPDHNNHTFACPRTWEFVHDMIHERDKLDRIDLANIVGAVGPGVGREFNSFTQIYKDLPTFENICKNPDSIPIPEKPDVIHAMTSLVSHKDNLHRLPDALPFVERLPIEFQVWTLRDVIRKDPSMLNHPAVNAWKERNAKRIR